MSRITLLALLAALTFLGCSRTPAPGREEVVLYSSVDEEFLRPIVAAFERQAGVRVLVVGDNEAVKTTGLMQRVLAERQRPQADVWWSSEPFSTIRLAREGALEPYRSQSSERAIAGGWPSDLKSEHWYGFALRFRVLGHSEQRLPRPPRTPGEMTDPALKGRIGMARPQFGTTRGHMAILLHAWGPDQFRAWLEAMRDNGLRLYDGNASAVRGVRQGEIDVCMTDTDDVWSAQRNGWSIAATFEPTELDLESTFPSTGPIALPNTLALVRGGPNPGRGRQLIDFLLSEQVERLLAESDSHNVPVRPDLRAEFARWAPPTWRPIDYEAIESKIDEALAICQDVLK
ncbi:MAG: ABC transporter substrate-binding protein [Phycisphaerales bacterium]|nr:ABC transporter substrate-binding protein [Phycisphaerales bacterium]